MRITRRQPSSKLRKLVIIRDEGCLSRKLDEDAGFCRNFMGEIVSARDERFLELDHIREEPGGGLPTDEMHLIALCQGHHRGVESWAKSHRPLIRSYLAERYPATWAEWLERREPDRLGS